MVAFSKLSALCGLAAVASGLPTILQRADQLKDQYDYVIVGGGTAGLTVADRLTESGKYSVLVVEYGLFREFPSLPPSLFLSN